MLQYQVMMKGNTMVNNNKWCISVLTEHLLMLKIQSLVSVKRDI